MYEVYDTGWRHGIYRYEIMYGKSVLWYTMTRTGARRFIRWHRKKYGNRVTSRKLVYKES